MSFPYVQSPSKLSSFLQTLPGHGVPEKLSVTTLKSWGFSSSNDRAFISVMKFIGFIDTSQRPTELWTKARGDLKAAVAEGVISGYSKLYSLLPDAHRKDDEALKNFFSANSTVGSGAISKMVSTFKALASLGDFSKVGEGSAASDSSGESNDQNASTPPVVNPGPKASAGGPSVNINIELHVPEDKTGEVYDKFFAAMKKHLFPND
mgnify:CR=1 FL=1